MRPPTVLIVFGATGDLMERKIAPALFHLFTHGRLPERFRVLAFGRRELDDEGFRERVALHVREHHERRPEPGRLEEYARLFTYLRGRFEDLDSYRGLASAVAAVDAEWGTCASKLIYLAVPPGNYANILARLDESGLSAACGVGEGWTRVLIEKPFGADGADARRLDAQLKRAFAEPQIYRIDHYLAKELLEGLLAFRFANDLFESSWNAVAIERIELSLLETAGVDRRGAFYDSVGALRDVGQNHLLEMLALVTMDRPGELWGESVQRARASAIRSLAPLTGQTVATRTYRSQHDGFASVEGVAAGSQTETFFRLETEIGSGAWSGVRVVMQAGKRLATSRKGITVVFRHDAPCVCPGAEHLENRVRFALEPEERIAIDFNAKRPGLEDLVERRSFDFFVYEKEDRTEYVEEYAKLLDDAIAGDRTAFVSQDEVDAAWGFVDPISEEWASGALPMESYPPDTDEVVDRAKERIASAGRASAPPLVLRREIGVVGLGRMGAELARNLLDDGWRVVGYNRTTAVAERMASEGLVAAADLKALVASLGPPRVVWLMLPAGGPVDALLFDEGGLASLLEPGDAVIDGGNSRFTEAPGRSESLAERAIRFIDVGTSGGPSGAREGACLMIGGERDDFERLLPLWRAVAVPGGFAHFPGAGAGHFVKMVHNGIEYGMMQSIAEGFTVLRRSPYGISLTNATGVFARRSVIESRLVGWLDEAFRLHGEALDGISGAVGSTGEGAWTVEAARELGVDVPAIEAAVRFRRESESDPTWTGGVLSALRERFGGHSARGSGAGKGDLHDVHAADSEPGPAEG